MMLSKFKGGWLIRGFFPEGWRPKCGQPGKVMGIQEICRVRMTALWWNRSARIFRSIEKIFGFPVSCNNLIEVSGKTNDSDEQFHHQSRRKISNCCENFFNKEKDHDLGEIMESWGVPAVTWTFDRVSFYQDYNGAATEVTASAWNEFLLKIKALLSKSDQMSYSCTKAPACCSRRTRYPKSISESRRLTCGDEIHTGGHSWAHGIPDALVVFWKRSLHDFGEQIGNRRANRRIFARTV